jgi:hypothetical protein
VKTRANFLPITREYLLDEACRTIVDAYESYPYLVGSCLTRPDYRDVDVRLILEDAEFARRFPGVDADDPSRSRFWRLTCTSLSLFLEEQCGMPIDFQIQQQTAANREFPGTRSALGCRHASRAP